MFHWGPTGGKEERFLVVGDDIVFIIICCCCFDDNAFMVSFQYAAIGAFGVLIALYALDSKKSQMDESTGDTAAWDVLRDALDSRVEEVKDLLNLSPSDYAADVSEWSVGSLRGTIDGFESPAVVWAVRYSNEGKAGAASVGFNVLLNPRLPVPHLTVYVGVRAGKATLMADHLPRFDLGVHSEHLQQFYSGKQTERWSEIQKADGLTLFRSADVSIRALQGPNALALSCSIADPVAVDKLLTELQRHVDTWIQWFKETPLLDDDDDENDETVVFAVQARDNAVRVALREHERSAGERVMGVETATRLSASMAGPISQSPCMAPPLAWRPDPDSGISVDEFNQELRRFAMAAQLEVANLLPEEALEGNSEDDTIPRIDVIVHSDLGAYMAAKPNIEIDSEGKVLVLVHAFVEPPWHRFERSLSQASNSTYTYVHEPIEDGDHPHVPLSTAKLSNLFTPALCLKLKRREAILLALRGVSLQDLARTDSQASADDDTPDPQAARRVNSLAFRWAQARAGATLTADLPTINLSNDRELFDAPEKPFGNKGGLYIESRLRWKTDNASVPSIASPTITTPMKGVPVPFLGSHYMKVLCPIGTRWISSVSL